MKNLTVLLSIVALCSLTYSGLAQNYPYVSENIKSIYETEEGRLHGRYTSFYPNGQRRAEGTFDHNGRKGAWSVYDTTGQLRVQREYANPFSYTQTLFYGPTDTSGITTSGYTSHLVYNADGYIAYFHLTEKMILWAKRIWRQLSPPENVMLYENDRLFQLIINQRTRGAIKTYVDEDFREVDTMPRNADMYRVVGYRMVEDVVFDTVRSLLEARIIALCPVVVNMETQDTTDLFWLYFPNLRPALAQEKITNPEWPHLKTLDDLFFYRGYAGKIYKEDNVYDRPISAYLTDKAAIAKEAKRIETGLIELEHDSWIWMSSTAQSDTLRR